MCNCKKQPRVETPYPVVTIPVVNMVPEPIKELTQEEIDYFNNIDLIEPFKEEDDE
jgi:hypothetical protein